MPHSADRGASLPEQLQAQLPALRAYVRLRASPDLRAHESCSDVVQSVCVEMLGEAARLELRGPAALRRWLFRAAERKLVDRVRYWRAQKRAAARVVDAADVLEGYATLCTPSQAAAATEEVARIERAFDALPPDYRDVIAATRLLGLSHADLAAESGRTPGAVRTQLCRALARLSELLAAGG